jgi:stage IV sporulation protein FB
MTTDPLMWSPLSLGRWFSTSVRVHIFLLVFVTLQVLETAVVHSSHLSQTVCWVGLLLLALAVHELGHSLALAWLGYDPEEVRLWPLGNMVGPQQAARTSDNALVVAAGPLANAVVVAVVAVGLWLAGVSFVWNPFGNSPPNGASFDAGAPYLNVMQKTQAAAFSPVWLAGWFGYVNYVILLANLLPALPFDGGRLLRSYAAAKDGMFVPWTARTVAGLLFLTGLVCLIAGQQAGFTVILLAVLIELIVRSESRMIEDDGFFADGVFGYDFSEGYTSLEGSTAKVRPYRESALKRWRRRKSEQRRQRRLAREAAEERRMDEILEKLHRDGRHALTDEEHRFLVRVSAKYRNRPKAHD